MERNCPVCGAQLAQGLRNWHLACTACTYEGSTLEPHILDQAEGGDLDEALRQEGLSGIRQENFLRLRDRLRGLVARAAPDKPKLLDVGCAHGWFLQATSEDFSGTGIEPETSVAIATRSRGIVVREGFFPDVLAAEERFDVIAFNDVLEHIPDINGALAACARHVAPAGIVMVNAPSSRGALYRIARFLARVGRAGSFERLWQKGFPSPHVHYLDTACVAALARRHGFELEQKMTLPSVSSNGLYARIRFSRDVSVPKAVVLTMAITVLIPFLAVLPSDIETWFLRRRQG